MRKKDLNYQQGQPFNNFDPNIPPLQGGFDPNMQQGMPPMQGGFNPNMPPMQNGFGSNIPPMQGNNNGRKKFNPLFVIIPVAIVLLLIIGFVMIKGMKNNDDPVETPPVVTVSPTVEPSVEPSIEPSVMPSEPVIEEPKYAYENDMLGIKFNYDSNLYCKENVEEIFNTIHQILPEGRDTFNIYSDKLPNLLNIVRLTTGDTDGLNVSVSISSFEIEKETTTLKIDGSTEVKNEYIDVLELPEEELIEKYDTQIKEVLSEIGCEIISYEPTVIQEIGSGLKEDGTKKLKGIMTSRSYSGSVDYTSSTGVVELLQCTIPVGRNAILITVATDGEPLKIDKYAIFNEIVNSIVVTTEGPLPEDLVQPVESETPIE